MTGRNPDALRALDADAMIPLVNDDAGLEASFGRAFEAGIDVVIDYLWGKSAERLLAAAAKILPDGKPLRFVQIGSISGSNIALPGAALRAKAITLMGSGLGSVPLGRLAVDIGEFLQAAASRDFRIPAKAVPLADVERAWGEAGDARTVFTIAAR